MKNLEISHDGITHKNKEARKCKECREALREFRRFERKFERVFGSLEAVVDISLEQLDELFSIFA